MDVGISASSVRQLQVNEWAVRDSKGTELVGLRRKLRIVFDRAVKLTELKFWTNHFADEILAQAIQACKSTRPASRRRIGRWTALLQDVGKAQQDAADAISGRPALRRPRTE